jgi:hypothetical protein
MENITSLPKARAKPNRGVESHLVPKMAYKKINMELIVFADEADSVVAELNAALDRLEEHHTLFGGGIETVAVDHSGTRKRSALRHTMAAGETAVDALRLAREKVTGAITKII